MNSIQNILQNNRAGMKCGIYAICTSNSFALEAALQQGKRDGAPVLIEATANQVNQFGGYTGMRPADFVPYVESMANELGFEIDNLILGGDHLGPVCWSDEPAEQAMAKARTLIEAYVGAGFKKIHLDTSMPCADDPTELSDDVVAARAAQLCEVAERVAENQFGCSDLVYVVGTEVPPPGGATESMDCLQVTPRSSVVKTIEAHKSAFMKLDLDSAWSRVVGIVVQPGVEFDHIAVHDYAPDKTRDLSELITEIPNLVYEAHSSDYQIATAYPALIEAHFAILKVGPQLTYAFREALFALSQIEDELFEDNKRAKLREVCDQVMLREPKYWHKYYRGDENEAKFLRSYSYSDRIRYYWNHPQVESAIDHLIDNLSSVDIPMPLLSQYLPLQYAAIRARELDADPKSLIRFHIMQVTDCYSSACRNGAV